MTSPLLSDIYIYPVKSLTGFRADQWPVDRNGLQHDRQWMLIDENNNFLSQRKLPRMALINTAIRNQQLILSTDHSDISLPLVSSGESVHVTVWHDQCRAETIGKDVDEWLSDFLHRPCRLVVMPDDSIRQVDQKYAHPQDQTAFSDGFPFLITSDASLQALNQHMPEPVDIQRFRPNLVISDCEPYAEDHWRQIAINTIRFRLPKPCSRCAVPGVNPHTAEREKAPLTALNNTRKWEKQVYFGQNALHDRSGSLRCGNPVSIIETGSAQPPL